MASNNLSLASGKRMSFGHHALPNASLMMEKQKATLRRSTPDSEALASSEDELDVQQRGVFGIQGQAGRPNRRPSWINDNPQTLQRKASLGGTESKSPGGSQHNTNTTDATSWSNATTTLGRTHSGSSSLPWVSTIWNNDNQKGLPSRFAEVLPSPTHGMDSSSNFSDEAVQSPSARRESMSEASFPFAIPLQPTLKSYRSQSYSVGQLDQETPNSLHYRPIQHAYNGRARTGTYSGLQHRPSRPSMLGEFPTDTPLSQLREVDDDEESTTSSGAQDRYANTQARQIEQLALENAILRQHAQMNQSINFNSASTSFTPQGIQAVRPLNRGLQISESVLEEADDDQLNEELALKHHVSHSGVTGRRQSDYAAQMNGHFGVATADQKYHLAGKKGHWQSSLGFGGNMEVSQSRRHSFADVPVRQLLNNSNSMDLGKNVHPGDTAIALGHEGLQNTSNSATHSLSGDLGRNISNYPDLQTDGVGQGAFSGYRQNKPNHIGQLQGHPGQSLYLVTFKAARAEFYYVQEGMGLEVNPGDLVIVEADRGTDLGTVAHKNVNWSTARELKEHYVTEHYNWLMMFSRQGQNSQFAATSGWNQNSLPDRGNVVTGGSNAPQAASNAVDGLNAEIKPKMIKRLAQNHEIHALREKEGNEAKAKRMCQQKVVEHHLNMEILDAEFQMDWKKLTFYYFADSYINFNSLVTDLFKIYKTRIWMSAINPASFVSSALAPSMVPNNGILSMKPEPSNIADPQITFNSHLKHVGSPSELTQDQRWRNQQDSSIPTSSIPSYSPYWSGNFQVPAHQAYDFSIGSNPLYRGTTAANNASAYFQGPGTSSPSKHEHKNESVIAERGESPSLANHTQRLQGLSLGP